MTNKNETTKNLIKELEKEKRIFSPIIIKALNVIEILCTEYPDLEELESLQCTNISKSQYLSFNYKEQEYKMSKVNPKEIYFRTFVLSHPLFNLLISRIAKQLGILINSSGIFYLERYQDINIEIPLSKSYEDTISILGLSPITYKKILDGEFLNTKEETFQYVYSSVYFDERLYTLKNRTDKNKIKLEKNDDYIGFLKWLEKQENKINFPYPTAKEKLINSKENQGIRDHFKKHILLKFWPDLEAKLKEKKEAIDKKNK